MANYRNYGMAVPTTYEDAIAQGWVSTGAPVDGFYPMVADDGTTAKLPSAARISSSVSTSGVPIGSILGYGVCLYVLYGVLTGKFQR